MKRRTVLQASGAAALVPASLFAQSSTYPTRNITMITPYSAGTGVDTCARLICERLSQEWKVGVTVDNRVGANGIIGTEAVARAAPDGYTLLFTASPHLVNGALYKKLPFDPVKDFKPVVRVSDTRSIFVVPASAPVNNLAELIAYVKARPGKLSYSSGGNGSITHLAPALLTSMAGLDMVHVPYKGGAQAITDTASGQVFMTFTAISTAAGLIQAGKLKAIAVSGLHRAQAMPDVPTVDEAGLKGFDVVAWNAILAPAGTPDDIVRKIATTAAEIASTKSMGESMLAKGLEARVVNNAEFTSGFEAEGQKWAKVVAISGAKLD